MPASRRPFTHAARHCSSVSYSCSNSASVSPCMIARIAPISCPPESILHRFRSGRKGGQLVDKRELELLAALGVGMSPCFGGQASLTAGGHVCPYVVAGHAWLGDALTSLPILVEGLPADAELPGHFRLADAGRNPRAQLHDGRGGEGLFAPLIGPAGP